MRLKGVLQSSFLYFIVVLCLISVFCLRFVVTGVVRHMVVQLLEIIKA